MSGPVDVVAVLDALALQTRQRGGSPSVATIESARAAVAELIEASKSVTRTWVRYNSEDEDSIKRIEKALAGAGGGV